MKVMETNSQQTDLQNKALALLDEIRAIAIEGLKFCENEYDRMRYDRLIELAAHEYEGFLPIKAEAIKAKLLANIAVMTPHVGADAYIEDEEGRLLILKRSGSGQWCIPCGWVDVGESAVEGAVRETREESGLEATPLMTFAILKRTPFVNEGCTYHHLAHLVYMQQVTSDTKVTLSHEHTDYFWMPEEQFDQFEWFPGQEDGIKCFFEWRADGKKTGIPEV